MCLLVSNLTRERFWRSKRAVTGRCRDAICSDFEERKDLSVNKLKSYSGKLYFVCRRANGSEAGKGGYTMIMTTEIIYSLVQPGKSCTGSVGVIAGSSLYVDRQTNVKGRGMTECSWSGQFRVTTWRTRRVSCAVLNIYGA